MVDGAAKFYSDGNVPVHESLGESLCPVVDLNTEEEELFNCLYKFDV